MATEAKFLTVKETANALGVSPNTVRAWGANGKLQEYRHPLNNYRLFKASDVERIRLQIAKPVLQTVAKTKTKRARAK